jgi:hypothetical protein
LKTDGELIRIVEEKAPEDLTIEEIRLIRRRLRRSPALREALARRIEIEGVLSGGIGGRLSSASIFERARGGPRPSSPHRIGGKMIALLLASLVVEVVVVTLILFVPDRPPRPAGQADLPAGAPADGRGGAELPGGREGPEAPGEGAKAPRAPDHGETVGAAPPGGIGGDGKATARPEAGSLPREEPPPGFVLTFEAEKFARGNPSIDMSHYGAGLGVIHDGGATPNFVEYDIEIPEPGPYAVRLRYAAEDPRPVTISANGRVLKEDAAAATNGSWMPETQTWYGEGVFAFEAGRCVLRLEAALFPHLDRIEIAATPGAPVSRPPEPKSPPRPEGDRGKPPNFRLLIEAEKPSRGNGEDDTEENGKGIGILYWTKDGDNWVEYDIDIPEEGAYRLDVRYATKEHLPKRLIVNGRRVKQDALKEVTGGWGPEHQRWFQEGTIRLSAGRNVLRLEGKKRFPHLDALAIERTPQSGEGSAVRPPWVAALAAPALPFAEAAFHDFTIDEGAPDPTELGLWIAPLPGGPSRVYQEDRGGIRLATFEGFLELRSPWPAGAVLRLALLDHDGLEIFIWSGPEGVVLHNAAKAGGWSGYLAGRKDDSPRPGWLSLAGTEGGRSPRRRGSSIDLRWQDEAVVVTCGDDRLLTIPLAGAPQKVFLEGRAKVLGISLVRSGPAPSTPPDARPSLLQAAPARLAWKTEIPKGASLASLPGGEVELAAEGTDAAAWAATGLPRAGLLEAAFSVEDPSPGTGLFLGDSDGRPLHRLGFFRESRTGRTSFGLLKPGEERTEASHDPAAEAVPFAGKRVRLRLIAGIGSLKCWVSGDGLHWSPAGTPLRDPKGIRAWSSAGVYAGKGAGRSSIRLVRLEVREIEGLISLAPEGSASGASLLAAAGDPANWIEKVCRSQPPDMDGKAWRRACALRTLAGGPPRDLGSAVLGALVEEAVEERDLGARRLRILEEAALLADTSVAEEARLLASLQGRLVRALAAEGDRRPWTSAGGRLPSVGARARTRAREDGGLAHDLLRREVLGLVHAGAWEDVHDLARWIRFRLRPVDPAAKLTEPEERLRDLADWADAIAARLLPYDPARKAAQVPAGWRHPLIEELSREGFNLLAEFEAAVGSESYSAACGIIASSSGFGLAGVLPDARDPGLSVSFAGAVALALRDHPELKRTMVREFGPRGLLRVRGAAVSGDAPAIEAATVQFMGTEAASEAFEWLGDRALAGGDAAGAIGMYEESLADAPASRRPGILARIRLASALLGREGGAAPAAPVDLNGARLDPPAFEALVREMREARAPGAMGSAPPAAALPPAPPPARYAVRATFKRKGEEPRGGDGKTFPRKEVDWRGRETAAAIAGDRLIVSNRFGATAFDIRSGEEVWSRVPEGERGRVHDWPLIAFRPLVLKDRLFIRFLGRQGPHLECLDLETGKPRWRSKPGRHVASDPLLGPDSVLAMIVPADVEGERDLDLEIASFDPESGEVLDRKPIGKWRDVWEHQIPCAAAASGDGAVAVAGGAVACVDFLGKTRWIKRMPWLPPDAGPVDASRDPPCIAAGMAIAVAPEVDAMEGLDIQSGRSRWLLHLEGVRRAAGLAGEGLVVEARDEIACLDPGSGAVLWRRSFPGLSEVAALGGPGGILAAAVEPDPMAPAGRRPVLVWLDPESGAERGRSPVEGLEDRPRIGPIVVAGERIFAMTGRGEDDQGREVHELAPAGRPFPGRPPAPPLGPWTPGIDRTLGLDAAAVLPGWALLSCEAGSGLRVPVTGARPPAPPPVDGTPPPILALRTAPGRPASLAREIAVPAGGGSLRIEAGHEAGASWKLVVEAGPRSLLATGLGAATARAGWRTVEIDLGPLAGSKAWCIVRAEVEGGGPVDSLWRSIEVR